MFDTEMPALITTRMRSANRSAVVANSVEIPFNSAAVLKHLKYHRAFYDSPADQWSP